MVSNHVISQIVSVGKLGSTLLTGNGGAYKVHLPPVCSQGTSRGKCFLTFITCTWQVHTRLVVIQRPTEIISHSKKGKIAILTLYIHLLTPMLMHWFNLDIV